MNAEVAVDPLQEKWTSETGLDCEIFPGRFGNGKYHLCGYVRIPEDHPLCNVEYSAAVPESIASAKDELMNSPVGKRGVIDVFCMAGGLPLRVGFLFDVHGGITFSNTFDAGGFWYGFDCGHHGDHPDIQDSAYVRAECERLAAQIKRLGPIRGAGHG